MRTSTSVVELILCFSIFLSAKITIIPVQAFSYSQRYVSLKTCQKFSPHTSITTTISGETPIPATTLNNLNHHLQNHSKNIISLRLSSSDTSTSTATRITHLSTTNIAKVNGDALDVTAILEEQQQKLILDQKKSILDDFTPRTPTLLQSMILFARFALETLRFNRRKSKHQRRLRKELKQRNKLLMNKKNEDIDDSINLLQEELETEKIKAELETSLSLQERMQKLNQFRKKIVHLVGYTRAIIIPSFAFLILGSLFTSIVPHYYSNSITSIATIASSTAATASAETKAKLIHNLLGLGIFSILMSLTTGLRGSLFWLLGSRGNYNVRTKLHRNLLRQEAAFFDGTETGVLISRLNNDVNKIGNVVSFHVNIVLRQIAQFIFGSVYLLKISPQLSMFTFAGIAAIGYISKVYGDFSRDIAERVQNQLADGSAVAETSFAMSETVRAFDGLNVETQRYELAQYHALELEEISAWAYGTHKFVSDSLQTIMQISLLFACWTIGQQRGSLSAAKLTTFMFYVNFVLESSNEVGDQWAKIMSAMGASSSAFTLIERIPKIMDPLPTDTVNNHYVNGDEQVTNQMDLQQKQKHQKPVIEMSNMTVTYDDMDSITPALQNINLKVYPGDKIAIVGRSGSGKSSMLRTLLRFYDPSWGKCILDGKVLTEYTRNEIANKVVMVEQEPHLFPMTLMENVLYGIDKDQEQPYIENGYALCEIKADSDHDPGCTGIGYNRTMQERVSEALELAGLPMSKENDDLGLTLDTRVGEGGRTLSGGQRQRVAIARALVRVPDVLLLDEPTAALDSKSEIAVVKALKQAMDRTRCMVMVTHRFSPIRSLEVNKVIVLDRGKIAEIGHPEDLLRQEGLYAQMAREQGIVAMDGIAN